MEARKVTVIGAGSWGTAVAGLVAAHTEELMLWAHEADVADGINQARRNPKYLKSYVLPANVSASSSLADVLDGAEAVMVVTPSAFLRTTLENCKDLIADDTPVCIFAKGIESGSLLSMSGVAEDVLGHPERICALSGPNHAEEVSAGKIAAAVIAGSDLDVAERIRSLVIARNFRAYVTDDLTGVEVCAAAKNVIAISCGIASGIGQGDNTLAALMTRGLAEMGRIVSAAGGQAMTCMGLAGMGDLIATCTSPHSRNRGFGVFLAEGGTLEAYEKRTGMVVEGARAAKSVLELANKLGVEAPITASVHGILYEGIGIDQALGGLLGREPNEEFYGIDRA